MNTSDSRVELSWVVADSAAPADAQREILLARLESRLVNGTLTVTASEERFQLRNRQIALDKLAGILRAALAPPAPRRRKTKPTKGSQRRRLAAKGRRSELKAQRRKPPAD